MPGFTHLHDDGLFFTSAQSLATGHGYRIASLPENPAQTKFPPLYPLYLSIVWRMNPAFPANLALGSFGCWVALAACLPLAWRLYRSDGSSEKRTWTLVALLGLSPYMILFGSTMFSEIFFTCFVLATFLLARREGTRAILAAGLMAGLAYLARTAGIALLISVPAWLLCKREVRRAGVFALTMLPFVAGWMLWSHANQLPGADATLTYYTDYLGYQFANVGFDNIVVVLWKNADQILYGMGSLVLPKVFDALPMKILTQVLAVAMLVGVVRMVRRGVAVDYALFAAVSTGILLVWHYPATERFVLPLFPLLIAGFLTEIEHLAKLLRSGLRHQDFGQRAVAAVFGAGVASVLIGALALQGYMTFVYLKESADQQRAKLADRRSAYQWMSANLPASAAVLSYDDSLLYLYSGHRGNYKPLMPRWWYAEDHASMVNAYRDLAAYCARRGLEYVYFTSEDLSRETGDEDRQAVERIIRSDPALVPIFSAGIGTVYRVRPSSRETTRSK
jgi:glycosyl transferase family 87